MNILLKECKTTFKGIVPTFSYSPKFLQFFVFFDKFCNCFSAFLKVPYH